MRTGAFLVREGGGWSTRIKRLRDLKTLSTSDQLIAAVLRLDTTAAAKLVAALDDPVEFCAAVRLSGLAGLILENCVALNLSEPLSAISLPVPAATRSNAAHAPRLHLEQPGSNVFEELTLCSVEAAGQSARFQDELKLLAGSLDDRLKRHLLFLKGSSLAVSCYEKQSWRLSGDIDIFCDMQLLPEVAQALMARGFAALDEDPGFCNQLGVGPVQRVEDLLLAPAPELVPVASIAFANSRHTTVELKLDPLDRGLLPVEAEQMFQRANSVRIADTHIWMPCHTDHLLIELCHLAKHSFVGWKWYYDVHLLAAAITESEAWDAFERLCKVEDAGLIAWVGLTRVRNLLSSAIPDAVLQRLKPDSLPPGWQLLSFVVNPSFVWNANSLPMLCLNAVYTGATQRKLAALKKALCPNANFLNRYYLKSSGTKCNTATGLAMHWAVLCLPAGVVRRTFGRTLFKS